MWPPTATPGTLLVPPLENPVYRPNNKRGIISGGVPWLEALMESPSSSSSGYRYGSPDEAAQAAALADMFTLKCQTDFLAVGLQYTEAEGTFIRLFCTLVTMSLTFMWFSNRKSIGNLLFFFSKWLRCVLTCGIVV